MNRSALLTVLFLFCQLLLTTGAAAPAPALPLRATPAPPEVVLPPLPANPQTIADFSGDGARLRVGLDGRAGLLLNGVADGALRLQPLPVVARPGAGLPILRLSVAAESALPPARLVIDMRGLAPADGWAGRFYLARRDPAAAGRWVEAPVTVHDPDGLISAPAPLAGEWEAGVVPDAWRPAYEPPAPDTYSGAATYTYALPLPAARGAWTPQMLLRYSSRAVDGRIRDSDDPAQLADGWALSATRIIRENVHLDQDMVNRPVLVYPDFYRLILAGAGYRLREVARDGSQTIFSAAGLPGDRIVRHALPTVDGRQRFFWTVERADGIRLRLGFDPQAVSWQSTPHEVHLELNAADAGARQAEYVWALDLAVDPYGNAAGYAYLTHTLEESLFYPTGAGQQEVIFATTTNRLLSLRYNFPGLVDGGWPHSAAPDGVPATTIAFRAVAGDDLQAGTFRAPVSRIYVFNSAASLPETELRLSTTVVGYESAGCDGYFTRSRLVTGLQQLAGTDADPATEDAGVAALPAVTFGYQTLPHFNAAGGDCFFFDYLAQIDNGYGATTRYEYGADGRTVGTYLHTPWARILPEAGLSYVVASVVSGPGAAPPVRHDYAYDGPCYGQAEPAVTSDLPGARGCGSPWNVDTGPLLGFDRVTVSSHTADGTLLRTVAHTFAQAQFAAEAQLRGRPLHVSTYDGSGALLLTEETTYAAAESGAQTPFFHAAGSTVAIHDAASGATLTRGTRRYYLPALQGNAQYGNLTVLVEQGDLQRQGDERTVVTCYVPAIGAGRWLVDRPVLVRIFAGELAPARLQAELCRLDYRSDDLLLESRTAYDGAALGAAPQRGAVTATWLGRPGAPLDGGQEGLLPGPTHTYDSWGNLVTSVENGGQATTFSFDSRYRLRPTRIVVSGPGVASQTTNLQFYGLAGMPAMSNGLLMPLGALAEQVSPSALVTRYEYDPFGRLFATYDSAADQGDSANPWDGNPRARQRYWDNIWNDAVTMTVPLAVAEELRPAVFADGGGSSLRRSLTYLDGYGRAVQLRARGAAVAGVPADVVTLFAYDAWGNQRCRSVPAAVAPTVAYVAAGCETADHLATSFDALGRMLQEQRPSGALTRYAYDLLDRPVKVVDPNGRTTGLVYDALGRKIRLDDPNAGSWTYGYDGSSNLVWQEDARGQRLCFSYDAFQRPLEKWSTASGFCASRQRAWLSGYTYDLQADGAPAPGMLTGVAWAPDGGANYEQISYDARLRPAVVTRAIDGVAYTRRVTAYDWFDQPLEEVAPNGSVLTHRYDAAGPTKLQVDGENLVSAVQRDALGRVTRMTAGNGVVTHYDFGPQQADFRLAAMRVEQSGRLLLGMTYAYDAVGNLVQQDEFGPESVGPGKFKPLPQPVDRQEFGYDALDRLVSARGNHPGYAYDHEYAYDAAGNLQAISDNLGNSVSSYTYGLDRPRLATAAGEATFAYDDAGFMVGRSTADATLAQQYDAAGRLTAVTQETPFARTVTRLSYDDGHRPVKLATPDGHVRHQPFVDLQVDDVGLRSARWQVSYRLGDQVVALDVAGGAAPGRYFVHSDQVGSRLFLTHGADTSGAVKAGASPVVSGSQVRYLPYGGSRLAPKFELLEERFAGHPLLAELGLVQMGARFYLPSLGRFLTPDALAPAGRLAPAENVNALTLSYAEEGLRLTHNSAVRSLRQNPLPGPAPSGAAAALGLAGGVQLDRYGYANYRPVQEVDPSGHNAFWVDIDLETAQALLDALLGGSQGNPGLLNLLGLAEGALDGIGTVTAALVGLVATPVAGLLAGLAMYVVSRQVGATLDSLQAFAYALRNAISAGGGDQIRFRVDHGFVGDQLTVSRAGGGAFTVLTGLFDRSGDLLIGWMMVADHRADVMWEIGGIVYYWRRASN